MLHDRKSVRSATELSKDEAIERTTEPRVHLLGVVALCLDDGK